MMCSYWLVVAVTALVVVQNGLHSTAFRISCYYCSSAYYRLPPMHFWIDDVPGDLCDTLIYSFAGLNNSSWEIEVLEPYIDIQLGGFRKAVALKKKFAGLRVLLAVGGRSEGVRKYSDMVTDPDKRQIFVKSVVSIISQYGFDGLDIDWEHPGDTEKGGRFTDKRNFVLLLKELKAEFQSNGWLLTATVPADPQVVHRGYDVPEMGWLLDEIHVVTYDMRGVWSGKADTHSALYSKALDPPRLSKINANDTIFMWHSLGAPKPKMQLGIPFYGRSFTLKEPEDHWPLANILGPGEMAEYTKEKGFIAYYEICSRLKSDSWHRAFDKEAKVPFMFKENQWIGFDDSQSLAYKVNYVKEIGLAGVMVFAVDLDDFRGVCGMNYPLLRTLRLRMDNLPPPPIH